MEILLALLLAASLLALAVGFQALLVRVAAGWMGATTIDWGPAILIVVISLMANAVIQALAGPCVGWIASVVATGLAIMVLTGNDLMTSLGISIGVTLLSLLVAFAMAMLLMGGALSGALG